MQRQYNSKVKELEKQLRDKQIQEAMQKQPESEWEYYDEEDEEEELP